MANLETLRPSLVLVLAGKDVSRYVEKNLVSFVYTDHLEGESDTLDVTLEDVDADIQDASYPVHGDAMAASIGYSEGYKRGEWLFCGDFQIDEVEVSGPPDQVSIKALAAGTEHKLRTPSAVGYDETTLADIADQVAQRNGLKLSGDVADVQVMRVTQAQERDLPFLRRLADEYGHGFTVRGDQLVMFRRADLKAQEPVRTLRREDLSGWRFRDKITHVVASAAVSYLDPVTKEVYTGEAVESGDEARTRRHSRDARKINIRAETPEQAQQKADAALERANEDQTEATLDMMGEVDLVAGQNIELAGFHALDGKYQIKSSRHSLTRAAGYTTSIECRRIRT
jgi:uncharacterized protein